MPSASDTRCPVCRSESVDQLVDIPDVPVFCNVLWPDREAALAAPRGDLRLRSCGRCGHVFNRDFRPELMEYDEVYENSLHHSAAFQAYADELAEGLIERHGLRGKRILEIACGKGDFLRSICRRGGNRGFGFDPSYDPATDPGGAEDVVFTPEYFGPSHVEAVSPDFVVCRHALEHFADPLAFLSDLRGWLDGLNGLRLAFEVPNGMYTFAEMGIWDLIYEHPSYFWSGSLSVAFTGAGFRVLDVREVFGGQFLVIEAEPAPCADAPVATPGGLDEARARYAAFAGNYAEKLAGWRALLEKIAGDGRRVAAWGGGSKGVTFMNVTGAGELARHLVDINPRKQGRFVPGGGQLVVGPEDLVEIAPDVVIVMNPVYRDEIAGMLAELGVGAEILLA